MRWEESFFYCYFGVCLCMFCSGEVQIRTDTFDHLIIRNVYHIHIVHVYSITDL